MQNPRVFNHLLFALKLTILSVCLLAVFGGHHPPVQAQSQHVRVQSGLHTYSPDPDSPITQSRTLKDQLVQSSVADTQAQKALRDAQTEFEKSRNDPNSPAYKLATAKLAVAKQNAAAATERASAYMGRYMQSAYNVGLDGKTLAGAPIISNDSGDQAVVGTGMPIQRLRTNRTQPSSMTCMVLSTI